MNRNIFLASVTTGALALAWVAVGFVGTNPLALAVTVIIAAVYLVGVREMLEFRRASASLSAALDALPETPASLAEWLERLHPSLRGPVRLRIEGERAALPGPALTPYLVGLLVMLGMLGTFLGMVVTLNGAVFALEGTTDLQAIRSALAAPIKGLGLAFGTSVAGVAASAMLGLASSLSRRERTLVSQLLDSRIATALRPFSHSHQRQETYRALQEQARALPAVVDQLQSLLERMDRREAQAHERLLQEQERFYREARGLHADLAQSVERSLKDSLGDSARVAGENIRPAIEAAMAGIAAETQRLHERMSESTRTELEGLASRVGAAATAVAESWTAALVDHERNSTRLTQALEQSLVGFNAGFSRDAETLLQAVRETMTTLLSEQEAADRQRLLAWKASLDSIGATLATEWKDAGTQTLARQQEICATLERTAQAIAKQTGLASAQTIEQLSGLVEAAETQMRSRLASETDWTREQRERMDQIAGLWRSELATLRREEAERGAAAAERLGQLQTSLSERFESHLASLGTALEAPLTRLVETASEAPRAAAEVIGHLRQEISNNVARDNQLLEERSRTLETLAALLESVNRATAEQRAAIDALVASSAATLEKAGDRFAERLGVESSRLEGIAAQVTGGAVEIASLGEALEFAVKLFAEGNEKLIANLQGIEAAMDKSATRSDEQLAYYVAQAREIIDLSTMSQKEIVDALRQLSTRQSRLADAVN